MSRTKKRAAALTAAVILVLALMAGLYAGDYYRADSLAVLALEGSEQVTVTEEKGLLVFAPEEPEAGLIFYPGGKVEYSAYAPLMLSLAEEGILCLIPEMPLNLAVLDVHAAQGLPEQYPEVERWFIGGHSLGGSMAASHASEDETFEGLILLASYSTADLTGSDLRVLSLYGSQDGVLNLEKYETYSQNLPDSAREQVIDGGNHAGFADYGPQDGDGEAEISAQEQRAVTAEAILEFIRG